MVVSVQLFGLQRVLARNGEIEVPLFDNGRVRDVLVYIKQCYPHVPLNGTALVVTVNNQISDMNRFLRSQDRVAFLPHIGGG
jgi:molybdopterin converting factor small subunit